ncbi:MAG: hypothetical protein ACK4F6_07005 [Hylemonella sp.]
MAKHVPKMSEADLQYAIKELEAWRDGERGVRLAWNLLEKSTGFSRQTLSSKSEIKSAYDAAKESLTKGIRPRRPRADDYLESRLKAMECELDRYKKLEAEWLERWVRIAYHARGKGLTIADLDKPLPPIGRK